MNADNDRQIRAWLDARDPGAPPARLREATAAVSYGTRGWRFPGLDYMPVRVFGRSWSLRPLAVLLVVLALAAAIVGAGLLYRWLQFPPRGLIAYTVSLSETGSSGIRLIAADGSGARQITASVPNLFEHAPRWSPDGRTLAFVRLSDLNAFGSCIGAGSIVLYDVETGSERVLVPRLRTIQEVGWSPAGDKVAFVGPSVGCSDTAELGVVDVASGALTRTSLENALWMLRWDGDSVSAVRVPTIDGPAVEVLPTDLPSNDGRFVATVSGPGRAMDVALGVLDRAAGRMIDLGAGGSPSWAPDGSSMAFVQFTGAPSEFGLTFRDRLAIATTGTWQVRTLADVTVLDESNPSLVRLPRLAWTRDGSAVYWMDMTGGHVLEVATGRVVDLPKDLNGCDDLQWQPTPRAD